METALSLAAGRELAAWGRWPVGTRTPDLRAPRTPRPRHRPSLRRPPCADAGGWARPRAPSRAPLATLRSRRPGSSALAPGARGHGR